MAAQNPQMFNGGQMSFEARRAAADAESREYAAQRLAIATAKARASDSKPTDFKMGTTHELKDA